MSILNITKLFYRKKSRVYFHSYNSRFFKRKKVKKIKKIFEYIYFVVVTEFDYGKFTDFLLCLKETAAW